MIGIVVVSHSRALATAAVALAAEMVEESARPAIAVAAGLDETTFGTDAAAVAEAVSEVDSPDGVLVMVDLGSAVLSAEMALEFVDPEVAGRVRVSSAPLVEGLVAAVVLGSTGATIEAVENEARRALSGKQDQLGGGEPDQADVGAGARPGDEASEDVEVVVTNDHGLHARPAAKLVSLAHSFDARITVANLTAGRGPVDAASLSMVATLNARQGDRLRVSASGPAAGPALAAIQELAERAFDDDPQPAAAPTAPQEARPSGSGLDLAIGPAVVADLDLDLDAYAAGSVEAERSASRSAVDTASTQLRTLAGDAGESSAAAQIFDAHLALLQDPAITHEVATAIDGGTSAPLAWAETLGRLEQTFEELDDDYQRARAQDIRSLRRRVTAALLGVEPDRVTDADGILVVPELDAATAATVDAERISGITTIAGGATGHGVIVAKSRGIPIITDVGEAAARARSGDLVAFDAAEHLFLLRPDAEQEAVLRAELERRTSGRARSMAAAKDPADTRDGLHVTVAANVTSVDDARAAAGFGADGSGLVRTEILFGALASRPGVDVQLEAFLSVAEALDHQPVTIRTWDVGGDKPLPFLPQPKEANPFLGERGLRLMRRHPDVLHEQLQAVCLAARETPVKVMFPMVSTAAEVVWALDMLRAAGSSATGQVPSGLGVGIMIEVPAAAVRAARLTGGLDFVSIGTNDLTQYSMAAERGNTAVADLAQALEPAVLALIAAVCRDVADGVEVAVCGDLAGDPVATGLLVGLGVRELSVVAPAVPEVKAAVREVDGATAGALARRALDETSSGDVRDLLRAAASAPQMETR